MQTVLRDFGVNYQNIPTIAEKYSADFENIKQHLAMKGKTLGKANQEQSELMFYYEERRVELYVLHKKMEVEVEKSRSKLYKRYTESYSRQLNDRAIDKYIDNESEYIDAFHLMLVFKELHDKYAAAVDAFKARGFSLKNLVELQVNNITEMMI